MGAYHRQDLNLHPFRDPILSRARLPFRHGGSFADVPFQHPSTVIRQRWVTVDEVVAVVADTHHLVNVEHSVADPALLVVDFLALARAGPGSLDLTGAPTTLPDGFTDLVICPPTRRTLAALTSHLRAFQRHPRNDPGFFPTFQSERFPEGTPREDALIASEDRRNSFSAFATILSHFVTPVPPQPCEPPSATATPTSAYAETLPPPKQCT